MTEGIRLTSSLRALLELQSLTARAREPMAGCVHAGWSLHFSPASIEAYSMKQAPRFGLWCFPRESTGMNSGGPILVGDIFFLPPLVLLFIQFPPSSSANPDLRRNTRHES